MQKIPRFTIGPVGEPWWMRYQPQGEGRLTPCPLASVPVKVTGTWGATGFGEKLPATVWADRPAINSRGNRQIEKVRMNRTPLGAGNAVVPRRRGPSS